MYPHIMFNLLILKKGKKPQTHFCKWLSYSTTTSPFGAGKLTQCQLFLFKVFFHMAHKF